MSVIAFLSSAVGGTLLSGLTQVAQEWLATRRMKAESEMRLNEARVMAELKMDESQWKAFTEAQRGLATSEWKPDHASPVGLVWAFGCAEILIKVVRPLMVAGAFFLIAHTYNEATGEEKATLATAIQTFAFSVGYFWIGQRYINKLSSGVTKK